MKFQQARINGVFLIEPDPIFDDRGFFAEIFNWHQYNDKGLSLNFRSVEYIFK